MKKLIVLVGSLLLIALMIFSLSACYKVEIESGEIVAVFRYGDADITKPLSDEDSEIVKEIFNGKNLYTDSPSCGFSENVALIIDGAAYCVACDDCGKIYNIEKDKYFNLSDKENEILRSLLCEYGFTFPCV
jgi:hypothetical protein